jgi:hypothetical protein
VEHREKKESQGAPPGDGGAEPRAAYEPPAIAWEEVFEPVAATSCGLGNPFEQNCFARPQV